MRKLCIHVVSKYVVKCTTPVSNTRIVPRARYGIQSYAVVTYTLSYPVRWPSVLSQ